MVMAFVPRRVQRYVLLRVSLTSSAVTLSIACSSSSSDLGCYGPGRTARPADLIQGRAYRSAHRIAANLASASSIDRVTRLSELGAYMISAGGTNLASGVVAGNILSARRLRRIHWFIMSRLSALRYFSAHRAMRQAYHSGDPDRIFAALAAMERANILPPPKLFAKLLVAARDENWRIVDESAVRRAVEQAPDSLRLLSIATLVGTAQVSHETAYSALIRALDSAYGELFQEKNDLYASEKKSGTLEAPGERQRSSQRAGQFDTHQLHHRIAHLLTLLAYLAEDARGQCLDPLPYTEDFQHWLDGLTAIASDPRFDRRISRAGLA